MNTYLLFKSLHLIAVISWMAGLLYLPRIFVYHSENNDKPAVTEVFKVMEKKLFFYIMTPAMTLSWIFGLILIHEIAKRIRTGQVIVNRQSRGEFPAPFGGFKMSGNGREHGLFGIDEYLEVQAVIN